jgi:hypothetical protein
LRMPESKYADTKPRHSCLLHGGSGR